MRDDALHRLDATTLLAAYRSRELSPVEVTRAVLAQVEAQEPRLHATWALDAEAALRQARDSEARWRVGSARPLDGVPGTLKENIATRGTPVPLGCAATELTPALEDAPPAARLRAAGMVLLAKTTMPDWGMLSSGLSSFHATTRNPWDTAMNPGGSSAGAGAAAAAGYGPLHLGTDIGGSIRLPAGWCGVVGLKPSLGRVPIFPPYYGRVAGPMTRTVSDAALMMAELSRPDPRDTMSLPWQPLDWARATQPLPLRGLRVGLLTEAGWGTPADPAVLAVVHAAARRFEAEGAHVVPVPPVSTRAMVDGLDRFWRMRSWLDWRALPPARQEAVLPYIRAWIAGAEGLSGEDVFRGFSQIGVLREAAGAAMTGLDLLLSPVSPQAAFPATQASPLDDPSRPFEHIAFTLPWNMGEQPAISVPAGLDGRGLPIGLQIIGPRHDDLRVLRAGRAWELLRDPLPAFPPGC